MLDQQQIDKAVSLLRQGGLVAFPTETVYGLGADASNPAALQKIFQAKGRPMDHPLIVHLGDIRKLLTWATDVSAQATRLAQAFWPGPLTLIFKKAAGVSDLLTGGQDTIGLRVPDHPVAHALLSAFGGGVAAPSANRYGRISPTTAAAVHEELGDKVDMILKGGQCEVGVESTIVDVSGDEVVILRPGMITAQQIEDVLQETVRSSQQHSPRVSGSHESHYAPLTPVKLVDAEQLDDYFKKLSADDFPLAVIGLQQPKINQLDVTWIRMSLQPKMYAHDLYATLREADKKNFRQIIIECVPADVSWDAIRDRLQRAAIK
jgi:L-threonylcarbamoyladenylate synthase